MMNKRLMKSMKSGVKYTILTIQFGNKKVLKVKKNITTGYMVMVNTVLNICWFMIYL